MPLPVYLILAAGLIVGLRLLFAAPHPDEAWFEGAMEQVREDVEGWMYERAWDYRRALEDFERRIGGDHD